MSEAASSFYEARPWLAHYDEGVPRHIDYPEASLPELFADSAKSHAGRVALRFMGRSVRYEELEHSATAIARRLRSLGVEHFIMDFGHPLDVEPALRFAAQVIDPMKAG